MEIRKILTALRVTNSVQDMDIPDYRLYLPYCGC